MNRTIIEFHIHELRRNIDTLMRLGDVEKAQELQKDLECYEQQLDDVNWRDLEDRVGLRSLERNA
jgi:hypothetical protein